MSMVGLSNYFAQATLNDLVGKTAMPALPANVYVALFTAVGADDGTGFTEVSGGSYTRVSTTGATWNAATGTSPSSISNASSITFPQSTASWGTVIAFGLYDASSAGNLLAWDYLGNFNWLPFTCTLASPGVLTSPAHGFSNGDPVVVTAEYGGILPTTGGSWVGALTVASASTDTFTAGVNTTSTGDGMVRKILQQAVPINITASFGTGALVLNLA